MIPKEEYFPLMEDESLIRSAIEMYGANSLATCVMQVQIHINALDLEEETLRLEIKDLIRQMEPIAAEIGMELPRTALEIKKKQLRLESIPAIKQRCEAAVELTNRLLHEARMKQKILETGDEQ